MQATAASTPHASATGSHAEPSGMPLEAILSIWWSMSWRTMLVGFLAAVTFSAGAGAILGASGRLDLIQPNCEVIAWLVTIPANIWGLLAALRKRHMGGAVMMVRG
jgi:hypothetical protein